MKVLNPIRFIDLMAFLDREMNVEMFRYDGEEKINLWDNYENGIPFYFVEKLTLGYGKDEDGIRCPTLYIQMRKSPPVKGYIGTPVKIEQLKQYFNSQLQIETYIRKKDGTIVYKVPSEGNYVAVRGKIFEDDDGELTLFVEFSERAMFVSAKI